MLEKIWSVLKEIGSGVIAFFGVFGAFLLTAFITGGWGALIFSACLIPCCGILYMIFGDIG